MRIIFRADASIQIGTGHQMRCLTLASELKLRGCDLEFISREIIGEINFRLHKLVSKGENEKYCPHSDWLGAHWKDDAKETIKYVKGADWLVIDHYAIDKRWEELLRPHVKNILVIDDLADRKHAVDLLLDQNYYKNFESRYNNLVGCEKLLGPKYALLRPEFAAARKNRKQQGKIKNIFICFGGIDSTDETGKAVAALKSFVGKITVVVGKSYAHYKKLKKNKKIALIRGANNIAKLMAKADLAIGAGGSMTWERAALGLPTIAWPIADNQLKILQDLNKYGALKLGSPKDLNFDFDIEEMSEIAFNLCDGKGARRIASHMLTNLRLADLKDSQEIFRIRNKKEVRKYSLDPRIIDKATHDEWFRKSLKNPQRHILVLELSKKIIGVLRYDIKGAQAMISVYIDPKYFGKAYGETLLEKGEYWLKNHGPQVNQLVAEILDKNKKSKSLFEKLGYTKDEKFFRKKI